MGIARTLTKNAIFQSGANIAAKLAALFLTVYLAAVLPPDQFGVYAWVLAIVVILDVFASIGTGNAVARFIPEALAKNRAGDACAVFRYLFRMRAYALAAVAASVFALADPIAAHVFGKPFLALPLRVGVIFLLAYNIREYLDALFVSLKKNEVCFFAASVEAVLKVALVIALVLFTASVYGALAGCILAIAASALYFYIRIRKRHGGFLSTGGQPNAAHINPYLKYVALAGISFGILTNIDLLMISSLLRIEEIGFYRIATSWAAAVIGIMPVYLAFPIFSGLAAKDHGHLCSAFDSLLKYITAAAALFAFGMSFAAKPLVALLYSPVYSAAGTLLAVLAFAIVFNALTVLSASVLDASGRPDVPTKIYAWMILLGGFLSYALITSMGLIGAAYAITATYIVTALLMLWEIRSKLRVRVNVMHIVKPLLSAGVALIAVSLLPGSGEPLAAILYLFVGLAVFVALELAIKGLSVGEVKHLYMRIVGGDAN